MSTDKKIRRAFDVFDIEGDGHILASELENALRIAKMNPTPSEVDQIKQELGNPERITYEQFLAVVENVGKNDQVQELKEAFQCFDPKEQGWISKEQLRDIVAPMIGSDLREEEFVKIIDAADLDGDGKIDIDEFVAFMMGE